MHPPLIEWSICQNLENAIRYANAAQGQISRSDPFRKGHDVGLHVPMIKAEPPTQPPETCDHLISDKQNAVLIANLANARKVVVLWNHKTTCALNGLCDKGCNRICAFAKNRLFQFVRRCAALTDRGITGHVAIRVGRRNVQEPRQFRAEHIPKPWNACRVHCANSHTVIAMLPADDLQLVRLALTIPKEPRRFDGAIICVSTARGEKEMINRGIA